MKTKEEARAIVNGLKALYPDGICSLQYQKDYELLFSVRLSAQCTDARVNKVTPALFAALPHPGSLCRGRLRRRWPNTSTPAASTTARAEIWWAALKCCCGTSEAKFPGAMDDLVKTPRHRPQDRQPHSGATSSMNQAVW